MDTVVVTKPIVDSQKGHRVSTKHNESAGVAVRLQRNQAEKQRRDKLNGYISELATLVPIVKSATKPVDKVSVLRLAAAHMRLKFSCLNPKYFKSKVPSLPSSLLSGLELFEKCIDGFVVATTFSGTILFCSRRIEDIAGYQPMDLIGHSVYSYVHEKEVSFFERKLTSVINNFKKGLAKKTSKMLKLHMMQRPLPRSSEVRYERRKFRISVHSNEATDISNEETEKEDMKSLLPNQKTAKCKDYGTSAILLMFVEPAQTEPKLHISHLLTHQDIYFTIHGLKGEIMQADHRISIITGYMPHEVQGKSAYEYIVGSDVPIALFAQRAMFTSNDGAGLITYRLKIFDSRIIYLQSKGQIVYKDSSTEISHFVCYNQWLSDDEGSKELKKFQDSFIPQIAASKSSDKKEDCKVLNTKAEQSNDETTNKSPALSGTSVSTTDPYENNSKQSSIAENLKDMGSMNDFSHCPCPYSDISGKESPSESFEDNSFTMSNTDTSSRCNISGYFDSSPMSISDQHQAYEIPDHHLIMSNQFTFNQLLMSNDQDINLAQPYCNHELLEIEHEMDVENLVQNGNGMVHFNNDKRHHSFRLNTQNCGFAQHIVSNSETYPIQRKSFVGNHIYAEELNTENSAQKKSLLNVRHNALPNGATSSDFSSNWLNSPSMQESFSASSEMPKNKMISEERLLLNENLTDVLNGSTETVLPEEYYKSNGHSPSTPSTRAYSSSSSPENIFNNHVNNFNAPNGEAMYGSYNPSVATASYRTPSDYTAAAFGSKVNGANGREAVFHQHNHPTNCLLSMYSKMYSTLNEDAANSHSAYVAPSKRKKTENRSDSVHEEFNLPIANGDEEVDENLYNELNMFLTKLCPLRSQSDGFGSQQSANG